MILAFSAFHRFGKTAPCYAIGDLLIILFRLFCQFRLPGTNLWIAGFWNMKLIQSSFNAMLDSFRQTNEIKATTAITQWFHIRSKILAFCTQWRASMQCVQHCKLSNNKIIEMNQRQTEKKEKKKQTKLRSDAEKYFNDYFLDHFHFSICTDTLASRQPLLSFCPTNEQPKTAMEKKCNVHIKISFELHLSAILFVAHFTISNAKICVCVCVFILVLSLVKNECFNKICREKKTSDK